MTTTAISSTKLPYLARLYNHTWTPLTVGSSFKANLGPLVAPQGGSAAPPLHWSLNGGGDQVTIFLPTRPSGAVVPVPGDIITLTEQGGDGSILYTGLIENVPEELGVSHGIVLAPLISELGDTPFTNNYTSATDPAQMIRDAVAQTAHCTATLATCPNTGVTGIYNFTPGNVLTVLDEARKLAGIGFYYFVDEIGQVWFGSLDTGKSPIYTIRQGVEFSTRKLDTPIDVQKNYVQAFGAIAPNTTTPLVATYDQTGSSVIGKRALIPPLQYPGVTDQTTLQNIVNTVGAVLNTPPVAVEVDLPAYGTRISLAPNLISNPSFESNVGQSTWLFGNAGSGVSSLDTSAPHGGLFALKQTNPSAGNYGGAFQPVGFPVAAGQILLLAVWAKASAGATLGPFRITFANPGANISTAGIASAQPSAQAGTTVLDSSPTLTTSYALYTHLVTVPSGFAWAFIELYANGTGVATAFWDDVIVFPTQGATIRYWEPAVQTLVESEADSGGYSAVYPVLETTWDGGLQHVIAGTLGYQPDDFAAEIERMINRSLSTPIVSQILPITPGQVVNATTGGSSVPATTAWVFAQWSTGLDNVAQVNNAYITVKWTPNAANDNVTRYEIRYSKNADGNYTFISVVAGTLDGGGRGFVKIAGLIQNTSYTFEIRAVNTLGQISAWSATQSQVTALDASAPSVPTGLIAAPIPRGALVTWTGNSEADLQGYRLQVSIGGAGYISITPGPGMSTVMVYVAPTGTPYGTTLQFQIQAVDWSGNASAFSAASTSITTDPVRNADIFAGAITAEKLSAVIVLASLLRGGAGAAHTEMDAAGFRAYDASGNLVINLPNDGSPAWIGAQVVASALVVTGNAVLQGTKNEIAPNAILQLDSSQSNPSVAPTLAQSWDNLALTADATADGLPFSRWSLCYDPAGGAGGATKVFWQISYNTQTRHWYLVEVLCSNGAVNRSYDFGTLDTIFSVARVGTSLFVLRKDSTNVWWVDQIGAAALSFGSSVNITPAGNMPLNPPVFPSLCYDGASTIYIVDAPVNGTIRWRSQDTNFGSVAAALDTGYTPGVKPSSCAAGNFDFGAARVLTAHHNGEVRSFTTAGVHQPNEYFPFPGSSWDTGITYGDAAGDGARFWTHAWQGTVITKHTTWTWTTASSIYWVGYSWYDSVATVHETQCGPRASITMDRRRQLIITAQLIPGAGGTDDPNNIRFYMAPNATDPGLTFLHLQATQVPSTAVLTTYNAAGSADPGANGFGSGTPAIFKSQLGGIELRGDGRARIATNIDLPAGTIGFASYAGGASAGFTAVTDVTGLTVTFTPAPSRRIRVRGFVMLQSTVAGDSVGVQILKDGVGVQQNQMTVIGANLQTGVFVEYIDTPTNASHTYKLAAYRNTGTGSVSFIGTTSPGFIHVEDIGT